MFNPGFTAPLLCGCPMVTVFHDLQHKRHPEYFRWFDLPFWNFLLWASARRSRGAIAVSQATARRSATLLRPSVQVIHHGVEREFLRNRPAPRTQGLFAVRFHHASAQKSGAAVARARSNEERAEIDLDRRARIRRRRDREPGGRAPWKSPAGFRASSFTSSIAARWDSSIHPLSKASACRCWKRWPPECRWRAPIFRRCARSRDRLFTSSIPQATARFGTRLLLLASGKISHRGRATPRRSVHLGENGSRDARLSQQVFQLNLGVGLRIAILDDHRRVQRQAPIVTGPGCDGARARNHNRVFGNHQRIFVGGAMDLRRAPHRIPAWSDSR